MRRFLYSIDRWGPGAVSVLTLFFLAVFGWWYSSKVARIEGEVSARNQVEISMRMEIQTLQAYVVSLKETMIRSGIKDVPPMPDKQSIQQTTNKKEK